MHDIKCVNEPSFGEYSVAEVIDVAVFTARRIMDRFPPCWLAANKEYRTFLKTQEKYLIPGRGVFVPLFVLFLFNNIRMRW